MKQLLLNIFPTEDSNRLLFNLFGIVVLLSIFAGIATEIYILALFPAVLLVAYLTLIDFRKIFWLLLLCIPLSTEITLPNGFGTDLPTEPLMVGLMGAYLLYVLNKGKDMSSNFIRHPISLILLLHVGWILLTTIQSDLLFVSIKFSLAKIWYIVVFYFLAGSIIKTEDDLKTFFWVIFTPMICTVLITLVRHAGYGFSFADVYKVMWPFHRNHVNYAAIQTLFFPFVWLAMRWYPRWSWKWNLLVISSLIMLVAIYLSFTRAAYVALFIAAAYFLVIYFKLTKLVLGGVVIGSIVGLAYFINDNKYLEYAPNFERTVTHKQFDNLIAATYQMEDISTMERLYRWVAGGHMSADNPWFGYGPGNFVNFYRSYTVTGFKTYVSGNEEQSGIHSYYLLMLVEQGIVGLLIYLLLVFLVLIQAERIYHQTPTAGRKNIVLAATLCLIVINAFQIINDLLEADKVGPFFFICMAILVNMDLKNKRKLD